MCYSYSESSLKNLSSAWPRFSSAKELPFNAE